MFIVYFLIVFSATYLDRLETLTCPFKKLKFPDRTKMVNILNILKEGFQMPQVQGNDGAGFLE